MAKTECYTPDGDLRMKEPVDARECVEHLGFTMEKPSSNSKVTHEEVKVEVKKNSKKKDKKGK